MSQSNGENIQPNTKNENAESSSQSEEPTIDPSEKWLVRLYFIFSVLLCTIYTYF